MTSISRFYRTNITQLVKLPSGWSWGDRAAADDLDDADGLDWEGLPSAEEELARVTRSSSPMDVDHSDDNIPRWETNLYEETDDSVEDDESITDVVTP